MAYHGHVPIPGEEPSLYPGQDHYPMDTLPRRDVSPSTFGSHQQQNTLYEDRSAEALIGDPAPTYFGHYEPGTKRFSYASVSMQEQAEQRPPPVSVNNHATLDLKDWLWEFAAATLNIAAFTAVVIVLIVYRNKPLASWNFVFDISLNTLIAILSTLSRTALLVPVASCISQLKWIHLVDSPRPLREIQVFDDASRGPWGSLELIWSLNFKTKLATWASIITILSLTMGPFAQQLLSYPSRVVLSPGATFYRSQIYDSGTSRRSTGTWAIDSMMDPKMQGAILNGLYNLSAPVQYTCATGNCHWNEFATLAVQSSCKNVTTGTKVLCKSARNVYQCNYTTPSGFNLTATSHESSGGGGGIYFNTTVRVNDYATIESERLFNSSLLSFAMIRFNESRINYTQPDVSECSMAWCAHILQNVTVSNGTFYHGASEDFDLVGVHNPFDQRNTTKMWDSFNVTNDNSSFPGNRTFSISPTDNERIKDFLASVFTSPLTGAFGLGLYKSSSNLTETLARIGTSMTYAMGQSQNGTKVEGQNISQEQYIHVNWPWIILPLAEVVMSIALLVSTLIVTHRTGVVSWKSSGIVPMLTAMDGWDRNDLQARSWRDVDRRSKHMRGVLVSEGGNMPSFRRTNG